MIRFKKKKSVTFLRDVFYVTIYKKKLIVSNNVHLETIQPVAETLSSIIENKAIKLGEITCITYLFI